jgi:hypothetical protein
MNRVLLIAVCASVMTQTRIAPAEDLPVGRWQVEFANGVVETCEIHGDGTATVVEPQRSSGGNIVREERTLVITFADDRIERWTPIGRRIVVEHWYPAASFPRADPVLGIADRAATESSAEKATGEPLKDPEHENETTDLATGIEELRSSNTILRAEVKRLNLQLLKSLEKLLRADPHDHAAQRDAAALAAQLAPDLPGNPIVWRVLVATGTLKDGMPLAAAENLLGPPTTRSDTHVEWYFNSLRRAAPCLRADLTPQGLTGWKLFRR